MQSIESLFVQLGVSKEGLETISPGVFDSYNPMKKKSSHIELASSGGIIMKLKQRSPSKAVYEFLALEVWHNLLNAYSNPSGLSFRAPKPLGLAPHDSGSQKLYMSFINGYELQRLAQLKRTTPVKIRGQSLPLPLCAAWALHLGALNYIKEREGLYHQDFDERHVLFSPIENVSMGVIDVENSRAEPVDIVRRESERIRQKFFNLVSSPRERAFLSSWYEQGANSIDELLGGRVVLSQIVEDVGKRYSVDFDFQNMALNGHCLRASASSPRASETSAGL